VSRLGAVALLALCAASAAGAHEEVEEEVARWVTRYDYTEPDHVGEIVARAAGPGEQLEAARAAAAPGGALFCYAALFPSADADERVERDAALRAARVEAIRSALGD